MCAGRNEAPPLYLLCDTPLPPSFLFPSPVNVVIFCWFLIHNEIFFSESGPYTIRNELFTGFLQTFLHSLIHPRMAKGPIWSVGYNPNQTVYGPDAVCTTERKHVVKPLYGSCSKCTCYVYKMFSNSLYNAVHIITKRCHCPVM